VNKFYAENYGAPPGYPGGDDAYQRSAMRVLEKIRDLVGVASVTVGPGWSDNDADGNPLAEPVYVGFGVRAIGTREIDGKLLYVSFAAPDPVVLEKQPALLETALRKVEYGLADGAMKAAFAERSRYMGVLSNVANQATAVEQAFKAGYRAALGIGAAVKDDFQADEQPAAAPTLLVPARH
jgi:hypothetical protein